MPRVTAALGRFIPLWDLCNSMNARYVDVVVIPLPTDALDTYRDIAAGVGQIWIDHGALQYFEGVEDDGESGDEDTSMRTMGDLAGSGDTEATIVGFVVFESQAHRDEVTAAVQQDPAYQQHFEGALPFDPGRMAAGTFESIVSVVQ